MKSAYKRISLAKSQELELILCQWTQGHVSPAHSHGWSDCTVVVQQGRFMNVTVGAEGTERRIVEAGQSFSVPVGASHEVTCLSAEGATIHIYSPPLGVDGGRPAAEADSALTDEGLPWADVERLVTRLQGGTGPADRPRERLLAERVAAHRPGADPATADDRPDFADAVVEALGRHIGWPVPARGGSVVPSPEVAALLAVHAARHNRAPEQRAHGAFGGPRWTVFVSEAASDALEEAVAVAGLGTDALLRVPADSDGRMNVTALRATIESSHRRGETPLLVVATAMTPRSTAIDPIAGIADVARSEGLWLHVDGAHGGAAIFCPSRREQLAALDRADSVTFGVVRLLGPGAPGTLFLTRRPETLRGLAPNAGRNGIRRRGPVWSTARATDALGLWMLWKSRGSTGLGALFDAALGPGAS